MNSDKDNITEALEAMIDRHGLLHVLTGLELICDEKAEHIATNWQDIKLAKDWQKQARAISKLLPKVTV